MGARIMILCGSPRSKGGTNRVVRWFEEAARAEGARVEVVDASRLDYRVMGCSGCMNCQTAEDFACRMEDDATPLLARMPEQDVIVLATPVYWFGPTAQLKVFTDRMLSLVKIHGLTGRHVTPLKGRHLVLIATAGGGLDDGLNQIDHLFRSIADFLSLSFESFLIPFAPNRPARIEEDLRLRERVRALARPLAARKAAASL